MSIFSVEYGNSGITHIWDKRYTNKVDITDGRGSFGTACYTLISDDISKGDKLEFTAYVSRTDKYCYSKKNVLISEKLRAQLEISEYKNGLHLYLKCNSNSISEFGINLPFSFMSSKNNNWKNQLLPSSPYYIGNKQHNFIYLTRPDGNNILVLVESLADGFKIDYSDFLSGHYIFNLKYLCKFDKIYTERGNHKNQLSLYILPVNNYTKALKLASEIYSAPALHYNVSSGYKGTNFNISTINDCNKLEITTPGGKVITEIPEENKYTLLLSEYGLYQVKPYFEGKEGLGCSVYCYTNWNEIYKNITYSIPQTYDIILGENDEGEIVWKPPHLTYRGIEDFNLCEQEMWALSSLRYLRYNDDEKIKRDTINLINVIIAVKSELQIERCTILESQEGTFPYNTKQSTRIQEVFAGVSILLEASIVLKNKDYLDKAVTIMFSIIETNIIDGKVNRFEFGKFDNPVDYTTVTAMIFPVVDLVIELKKRKDSRFIVLENTAIDMADYVVKRGYDFPTEGGEHESVGQEMEEGSISCSALTVLYVAKHIVYKEEYIKFAEEILGYHDAWTIHTCFAPMFRSSLRWWETIWEGDSDGPAICCGHAWTIWRAEAEFIYGILTKSTKRVLDSYNAYMSNFSKIDNFGNMYAIYQCEPICGGGPSVKAEDMQFIDKRGFPERPDISLSRYVFARATENWFCCTAVIEDCGEILVLNGVLKDNTVHSLALSFDTLYIDVVGVVIVSACNEFKIISPRKYSIKIANSKTHIYLE